MGIKKRSQFRNRLKSDTRLYELFCVESHILSFPEVSQIPPESPCMKEFNRLLYNHETSKVFILL